MCFPLLRDAREAVAEEVKRISRAADLTISVTSEGDEHAIGDDKQLILFRIIQECLNNCLKHAHATNINIGFSWYPTQLRVRARVTGGSGDIRSRPGEGTVVTVQIPYE